MNLIGTEGKKEINKFLSGALPPIRKGLKKLYPKRKLIFSDGQERLNLLYLPFQKLDRISKKPKSRTFPRPHGDTNYEWNYLEGELAGLDWDEIALDDKAKRFPERNPPFPVTHWPICTPNQKRDFPTIDIKDFLLHMMTFDKSIPIGCWMLFMNDIPRPLWKETFFILIHHYVRLSRLARLYDELQDIQLVGKGMLPPKKGLSYLHALYELLPKVTIDKGRELSKVVARISVVLKRDRYFAEERFKEDLAIRKKKLEDEWKKLKGPDRRYKKEASRYLQPLIRELYKYLYLSLNKVFNKEPDKYLYQEQRSMWLRTDHKIVEGDRVNEQHIYRLIGDLIRFFYDWDKLIPFNSAIELPDWRGDQSWSIYPDDISQQLAEHQGKPFRKQFGKRIQQIHRQTKG